MITEKGEENRVAGGEGKRKEEEGKGEERKGKERGEKGRSEREERNITKRSEENTLSICEGEIGKGDERERKRGKGERGR